MIDTTSNNFTFQTFSFERGSLNDVAIVSDTDIWAVGQVYFNSIEYNAVHWDGKEWHFQKIPHYYKGQVFYQQINAVFAIASNDVWFAGDGVQHWDGQQFSTVNGVNSVLKKIMPPLKKGTSSTSVQGTYLLNRIWASSNKNIYLVGFGGTIVHYDGLWHRIPTRTSLEFNDIYGSGGQVLAVCQQFNPEGSKIFSIQGNTAKQILSNSNLVYAFNSVWFVHNEHYYIVGDGGIIEKNLLSDSSWADGSSDMIRSTPTMVRGNGTNDVFVVGGYGEFLHWNGIRWKTFIHQTGLADDGTYFSISVNRNLVVAVGVNNIGDATLGGTITVGKRQ
ncbi:MAG: hypothetical protein ABSC53_08200 [Bacteroidota bacterium]